jgi:uncharacterized repeat protein (TIGR03803 family)
MSGKNIYRFINHAALVITMLALATTAWGGEKVLHAFHGGDGWGPENGVIADGAGNLYGTASFGGPSNKGVVFNLTPGSNGLWKRTILHQFTGGSDGAYPYALVRDTVGNLFGTARSGGTPTHGTKPCQKGLCGVVFQLSPGSGGWNFIVLHSFTGYKYDGSSPEGVTLDAAGNLYITSLYSTGICLYGCGVVFKLIHTSAGWTGSTVHSFAYGDGENPQAPVILDAAGNLFGTTLAPGGGTVYEISPVSGGGWTERILSYVGGSSFSGPTGNLVFDSAGNLFGTTWGDGASGKGTVFELTHGSGGWTKSLIYSFTGGSDGWGPNGLVFDSAGNLYGTTSSGGNAATCNGGCGVVYKLTPVLGGVNQTVLYAFTGGSDGQQPLNNGLVLDPAGHLFGTTEFGGATGSQCFIWGCGTVFEVTP